MELNDSNGLTSWVVYDHPIDVPTHYVARRFVNDRPTLSLIMCLDLEELRRALSARGLMPIVRDASDDPKIVETWL